MMTFCKKIAPFVFLHSTSAKYQLKHLANCNAGFSIQNLRYIYIPTQEKTDPSHKIDTLTHKIR